MTQNSWQIVKYIYLHVNHSAILVNCASDGDKRHGEDRATETYIVGHEVSNGNMRPVE